MAALVWKQLLRKKAVWFSLAVMLVLGMVAALAPLLAPHDPYRFDSTQANLPPAWAQYPTPGRADFPLGSDRYGRDILSRLLYGTRTAVFLALLAVPLAGLIGTLAGLSAGWAGGRIDRAILFICDTIQALPGILFMVIIVLIFRDLFSPSWLHGLITLVIGFAAVSWASLARLVRAQVLQLKHLPFIEASISLGGASGHILARHLLPNVQHLILAWVINNIPAVILLEAVLGYIGVGVTSAIDGGEFTTASWGGLFFSGRSALTYNPLILILPSLCLLLISMSFILLADALNDITHR